MVRDGLRRRSPRRATVRSPAICMALTITTQNAKHWDTVTRTVEPKAADTICLCQTLSIRCQIRISITKKCDCKPKPRPPPGPVQGPQQGSKDPSLVHVWHQGRCIRLIPQIIRVHAESACLETSFQLESHHTDEADVAQGKQLLRVKVEKAGISQKQLTLDRTRRRQKHCNAYNCCYSDCFPRPSYACNSCTQ